MQIRVGYSIAYECSRPTPMVLLLSVHPSRLSDLVGAHRIDTEHVRRLGHELH